MTTTKKLIFFSITMLIGSSVLVTIEFILGKLYPQYEHLLVQEVSFDQIEWNQIQRGFLKTYFTTDDALVPEFKPAIFRKEKPANSLRIFCLGESSMFGVPYQMTANIPGILRRQLRARYPQKEIEVINLGASAINTNVIRHFAPRLLQYNPDLILIYTGHNEFYGPDGITASWLEKQIPWITQLKYSIRELTIYQLLASIGEKKTYSVQSGESNLMLQVSNKAKVELRSTDAGIVFRNFEHNLIEIISLFKDHDIPVMISDVTSNLTFPPFDSDTSFQKQTNTASALLKDKKFTEAIELLMSLDPSSEHNALIQFTLGRGYAGISEYDSAIVHFRAARDHDLLKFRAPQQINGIIRRVSEKTTIPFISTDSIFAAHSRNGIPDTSLFWEHLHPTIPGYYLIANGFFDLMKGTGVLQDMPAAGRNIPLNFDSLHICWFDRAFGDRTIASLTSKWPFRGYGVTTPTYASASAPLRSIVDQVMTFEKVWDQGCYETAQIFWREGRIREAITTYRAVIDEYPYNFYAHYLLGSALSQLSEYDDATSHYETAIRSNPAYPFPMVDLGLLLINRGEYDKSISLLNRALFLAQQDDLVPLRSTIHYGLATAFANKQQYTEAIKNIDRSLQLMPSNKDAQLLKQKIVRFL